MGYEVITSSGSGSWTVPSYVHKVKIMMLGAGGGGGGAAALTDNSAFNSGGGGGGGASVYFEWDVTPGSSISYVIGSGGAGGSGLVGSAPGPVSGSNGKDGGATSCTYKGTTYSAEGGRGGGGATALSRGGGSGGAGGAGASESTYSKCNWKSGGYSGGGAGSSGSGYGAGSVRNGSCGGGGGGIYSSAYNMVKDVYHKSPLGGQGVRVSIEGDAHYQFMEGYLGTGGAGGTAGFKSGNITAIAGGDGGNGVIIIQYSELHAIKSGSGTWSTPSGVFRLLKVAIIGAGGGGGGSIKSRLSDNTREGGGGGGGGSVLYSANTYPGKSWSYSVGSGGSGGRGISNLNTDYITGNPGGDGGDTKFMDNIMSGGKGGGAGYKTQSGEGDGSGGAGGAANSSLGYPSPGGSGGAGGRSGSGYGAGSSIQNAGGGGGGIGNAAAYYFASDERYTPNTPSSKSIDASDGGKNGRYGTGGGGDSGFDSSGKYGVGGRGGDGLILIEYPLAVDTVSFTINSKNGIVKDPRLDNSERTSVTVLVPIGATYSVIKEQDDSYNGKTGEVEIRYDEGVIYSIPVSSDKGYGNPVWTSKSGTISSSTTISVTYSKSIYSGTVYLGIKYKKFRIRSPSDYAGEYESDKEILYYYRDYLDVDWTGGTTIETVSPYVQRVYTHPDTRSEEVEYVSLPSQTGGDGKTMDAQNSNIFPDPRRSPKPDSYTEYYRARINFDANGGTLAAGTSSFTTDWDTSQDIYADLPSHPTRTNYIFKGWAINNSNPDPEYDPDVYPNESGHYFHFGDVILYAIWEGIDCSVTVSVINFAGRLQNFPLIYGYWSNENEGEKANQMEIAPRGTSIIPVKYNGRIWGEISEEYYDEPRPDTVYKSIVWKRNDNVISFPQSITATDITLKLYLYPYGVTIKFYKNDGTSSVCTLSAGLQGNWYVYNDINFPKYAHMNLGANSTDNTKVCIGWSTDANASVPDYADGYNGYVVESTSPGDVTVSLYAVWGEVVTVYFDPYNDSNSNTVYSIKTNPATGRLISTPPTPTPLDLDWAFSGWKCTQVSYFNTPRSSSEVAAYSFRGVGTELWFFGVYMQRKYYPVVFVDNLDSPASIAKCMKNEKPVLNWSDTIKTDDGKNFNPSAKSWQPYQSSQIFEAGYSKQVKLNKIINVFYCSGAPNYSDDNIHMAVSCGEYGIIDLGDIQDISDSYSAMLTTIPIAPFGYSGTFCMDRGVQRSLSVGIVRVSPVSPDDSSTDSRRWSNSKWISMLRAMTDRWQMMTDGVRLFMYVPNGKAHNVVALNSKYSLTDGHINGGMTSVNAYISQLPLSYSSDSVHKISLSMTFRVGTIYPKPPEIKMTAVTLKVGSKTKVIQYPSKSYSALPRCPAGMLDESVQIFYAWKVSTTPTIQMYPGDAFFVDLDAMTLTALYTDLKSKDCDLYTSESAMTYTVNAKSGKTHVTICAVGGGGAGAVGTILKTVRVHVHGGYINPLNAGGGGGGSGYLSSRKIPISEGDKLYIKLGKGGQTKGASGERTSVYLGETNGKLIVYADGGAGGKSGKTGGSGGAGFKSGGAGGYPFVSKETDYPNNVKIIASMDGDGAPEAYGLGGVSSTDDVASVHYIRGGAGGGGAPPRVGTAEGMGGSGLELRDSSRSVDGTLGGGGGGTWGTGNGFGKGGDGYVCLFWE